MTKPFPVPASRAATIRVGLYCCIPEKTEDKPRLLSALERVRRAARVSLNEWTLRLTGRLIARFFDYETLTASNRGDIAIRQQIRSLIDRDNPAKNIEWIEVAWGTLDREKIDCINRNCDLFIVAGGAFYRLDSIGPGPVASAGFERDVRLIEELKIPLVTLSVGFGGVFTPDSDDLSAISDQTARALRAFHGKVQNASVRDSVSADLLEGVGIRRPPVVPDPVLYFKAPAPRLQPELRPRIGLNLAFSGRMTQDLLRVALRPVATAIKEVVKRHEATIVYIQHSDSEQAIPGWLKYFGVDCEVVSTDPERMMGAYAGLTLHIGSMMHSCIFAFANDVPTIGLAYGIKHKGLFDLLQQSEQIINLPHVDPKQIVARVEEILARRKQLSQAIAIRRRELQPALAAAISDITLLIDKICDLHADPSAAPNGEFETPSRRRAGHCQARS